MNDLLDFFLHGSCGSLKNSMKSGVDLFTLLFIFICAFFMLGKMIVQVIRYLMVGLKK